MPAFSWPLSGWGAARPLGTPPGNQVALQALAHCGNEAERLALRNLIVRNNLPLVYAVTARMARTVGLPADDLRQIGSLGLLRAVEAFNPGRGRTLSSFAVPYIRGAIQHELRDRVSLMRIPRALWELRRRATVLQERRRRLGHPQLAPAQLARALGCSAAQLVEALQVGAVVEMRSLDAPCPGEAGEEGAGRCLGDLVPDPASLANPDPVQQDGVTADGAVAGLRGAGVDPADRAGQGRIAAQAAPRGTDGAPGAEPLVDGVLPLGWPVADAAVAPELAWLQQQLVSLTPVERELVVGHVCSGRTWAELARELGLHPRQAQRRTLALLDRLQGEGRRWRRAQAGATSSA